MNFKQLTILAFSMVICLNDSCSLSKKVTKNKSVTVDHVKSLGSQSTEWEKNLHNEVLKLGNFNWIIIAEPAFPSFNKQGLTTIVANASSPEVLLQVIETIEKSGHVQPNVYISRENIALEETEAPGINTYRTIRDKILNGREARALPHNALELLLMDAKKKHRVLVIKSNTLLPYSSIFLELESGYWDGEAETSLRKRMKR